MPITSSLDAVPDAATALSHALTHPAPATPFANVGHGQMVALKQLTAIFATTVPDTVSPPRVAPNAVLRHNQPRPSPSPRVLKPTGPPATNIPPVHIIPPDHETQTLTQILPHPYPLRSQQKANAAICWPFHEANSLTGQVQEYQHLIKVLTKDTWVTAFANEHGRLSQHIGKCMLSGTDTVF
jgi:hypothetical protein